MNRWVKEAATASNAPTVAAISPALGTVKGGTTVTLQGTRFESGVSVAIGGVSCSSVNVVDETQLTCVTGDSDFSEGAKNVVVSNSAGESGSLSSGFTYQCPWTTTGGRRSCGAVPPATMFPAQATSLVVTEFQSGHGFVANAGGASNLDDTTDFVLGTQSASITSNGAGAAKTLRRTGMAAMDFTGKMPKIWVKVTNLLKASSLQLYLGDTNLANYYRFSFRSSQGQRWTTEGDWVSFTLSWSPTHYTVTGTPNRAAITDVQFRVVDDATGAVTLQVNGLAAVDEPTVKYPNGVLSLTFDDDYVSQYSVALPLLAAQGYKGTAYVINDTVGTAGHLTVAQLTEMQNTYGWDVSAHAHLLANHNTSYPNMTATAVEDDMVDTRAWLISNGFRGYDHCAYPKGEFTGALNILSISGTYFSSCRTIYTGQRETYYPSDYRKIRVQYVTNATTLADLQTAIDNAVTAKEWIVLVFHNLVSTAPAVTTEWPVADFTSLISYIAGKPIAVKSMSQVLND
jgi:peptidoglycan/xylan/chitin deacetylase (PgdA/CDA1 family)